MTGWGRERKSIFRFLLVGGIGFFVDAGTLTWLVSAGISPYTGRIASFVLAVSVTFILNRHFTFRATGVSRLGSQVVQYLGAQLGGAAVNISLYMFLLSQIPAWRDRPWIPLAVGSIAAMCLTFILSRWVFRR